VASVLFGCGGGDYETSSGFPGMSVSISGLYAVERKDPGILPNFYSIQLTHSGRSLQGLDNLGRTWTGTLSDMTYYGVYPTGQEPGQQQPQQQQQQQQQQLPQSFHGEIYLTTQSGKGTNYITGVVDTQIPLSTPTGQTGQQQQQQQTTGDVTVISGTVVDSAGHSGYIVMYNTIGQQTTAQQTP